MQNSELQYRYITNDDLDFIREVYNYYILHSTATFHTEIYTDNTQIDFLPTDTEKYPTLIFSIGDTPVGFGYLGPFHKRPAYAHTAEVTTYFHHEITGKGYGRKALQILEQYAYKSNIECLIACITAKNSTSIRLFEKERFEKCGHFTKVGYKFDQYLDVVYLQKLLEKRTKAGQVLGRI